jgi:Zn-dependent membrane protease YugP
MAPLEHHEYDVKRATPLARARRGVDYDPRRVGVRFEESSAQLYDTSAEGLSAAGHELGRALTDDEVEALLAYLTTL